MALCFFSNMEILQLFEANQVTVLKSEGKVNHPQFHIETRELVLVAALLRNTHGYYFDLLSCVTGLDLGFNKDKNQFEVQVVYTLYSIAYNSWCSLYVTVERDRIKIPSVGAIWPTAYWHEREAYDLLGIEFENHPDLRRILLPADWEGYPLRKDYKQQEVYHGLKTESPND
jgi:NADH-quinone oxidoreductase subunit C